MKNALVTLAIMTMTVSTGASASSKWVQGPFWKAPQVLEFKKKLVFIDQSAKMGCDSYKDLVEMYKERAVTDSLIKKFKDQRVLANGSTMNAQFIAKFVLAEAGASNVIQAEAVSLYESSALDEALPMYTQSKATTSGYLSEIYDLNIESSENSLVAFSRKLGLEDSDVRVLNDRGQLIVAVYGRDAACDLIERSAYLKGSIPTFIKLPSEVNNELNKFYSEAISPIVNETLVKNNESLILKAARFGMKAGKALEAQQASIDDTQVEKQLGSLLNVLFAPKTLTPSAYVQNIDNKNSVKFTNYLDGAAASIQLGL